MRKVTEKEKEVYIVRIVRRSNVPGETLVGIVEDVLNNRKKAFKTEADLLKILAEPHRSFKR